MGNDNWFDNEYMKDQNIQLNRQDTSPPPKHLFKKILRTGKWLLIFLLYPISMFTLGIGLAVIEVYNKDLPSLENLDKVEPMQTTKIYALENSHEKNGRIETKPKLLRNLYIQNREISTSEEIPQSMKDAIVAVEDHRFYEWYHFGVDPFGMLRALVRNVSGGKVTEGASSITQQYVRNAFFGQEKTFYRKFREMLLAIKIEKEYNLSKQEILVRYLNRIWFGHGAYGIKSAARVYFDKPVDKLTKLESAMLAAIVRNPSAYSPFRRPKRCQERLFHVLRRMYETNKLSKTEYDYFLNEFNTGKQSVQNLTSQGWRRIAFEETAPYFIDAVRNFCVNRISFEKTRQYLPPDQDDEELNELYVGGYKIETTLDLELQKIAEQEVAKFTEKYELKRKFKQTLEDYKKIPITERKNPAYIQCALIAIDPKTGEVKAMVGGRNYEHSKFNRVTQAHRQPGSSFKPVVYALALEKQFSPSFVIIDDTLRVEDGNKTWMPKNYSRMYQGPMTLRYAIAHSVNIPAVKLAMILGINDIRDFARKIGIHSSLPYTYSLALGTGEITPLELAATYCIFANGGNYIEPVMVKRISAYDGKVIFEENSPKTQVISPQNAYIMQGLLSSVLDIGTAKYARRNKFNWPAGGKTGTTSDNVDAWFVGFTPKLVCVVWIGFDKRISLGRQQTGGDVCLPLWTSFMKRAHEQYEIEDFKKPPGIVERKICKDTGKLASPSCTLSYNERFISGFEPTEVCEHDLLGKEEELPRPGEEEDAVINESSQEPIKDVPEDLDE